MRAEYRILWHLPDGTTLESDGYAPLNLLAHAEILGIPLPQACGGQAECGTCRVRVLRGDLTPPSGDERVLVEDHRKQFAPDERLSCRARPRSDLELVLRRRRPRDLRED
ncbi:MAG: (2Fe-2S)-binding protein [Deltaproteobacteria bacterium]|nr:(2Fe-2S)-binding protein [Deltaproteobacteria bacterium]MCB9789167.1 (2Fe-2S)-binding protein [Deltaproteobacteria bacterium]